MSTVKILPKAPEAFDYPLLVKSILAQSLKYESDREIVYRNQTRFNYIELNKRICQLANVLGEIGIEQGDTVAVIDYDSNRYLECFFSIPMVGAVLHTINFRLSPEQVLYTINHAEDKIILVHRDFLPLLEGIANKITTVKKFILLTDDGTVAESALNFFGEYEQLLSKASDDYIFPNFDENAVATTFYTTGTTGNPKGVYFSHRQLVLHTLASAAAFGSYDSVCRFRSNDVYMPITPMFHVHAWGVPYLATMLGVKQIYPGRYEPEMLLQLLIKEKVTFSHCVPTILQMLVSSPIIQSVDLSNWKVVIGGAALPSSLAKAALNLGIDVITGYGMSETCPILSVSYLNIVADYSKDESVSIRTKAGIPIPMVEMNIVDETGMVLPQNGQTVGEIVVRSPWLTQGYFREPEKSAALWEGGYLHTGDVGSMDENNVLKISDRIKDVIKTGGEWISSLDLENLIGKFERVAEVAVVVIPDAKWTERPYALIVLKKNQSTTAAAVQDYLQQYVENGTISKWTIPQTIDFVLSIPKTSVGKIDKKKIRANYQS